MQWCSEGARGQEQVLLVLLSVRLAPSELVKVDLESLEEGLSPLEVVQDLLVLVAALKLEHLYLIILRFGVEHSECCRHIVVLVLEMEVR